MEESATHFLNWRSSLITPLLCITSKDSSSRLQLGKEREFPFCRILSSSWNTKCIFRIFYFFFPICNETEQLTASTLDHLNLGMAQDQGQARGSCRSQVAKRWTHIGRCPHSLWHCYPIPPKADRQGHHSSPTSCIPAAAGHSVPSCFFPIMYCGFWVILGFYINVFVFSRRC